MESNDSPEIRDRGVTSDIPGLPSGFKVNVKALYKSNHYYYVIDRMLKSIIANENSNSPSLYITSFSFSVHGCLFENFVFDICICFVISPEGRHQLTN